MHNLQIDELLCRPEIWDEPGLQRQQKPFSPTGKPIVTVQGVLENALKQLRPVNDFKITLSSRTDKGVHSLRNACHVDLQYPEIGKEYIPEVITNVANYHLKSQKHDVRVLETRRVSNDFHARFLAYERRYVYRIAHTVNEKASESEDLVNANKEMFLDQLAKFSFGPNNKYRRLPFGENLVISDAMHMKAFREKMDISKLLKAAELLSGIHDYSSFTRVATRGYNPNPVKLMTIGVKRGLPIGHHMFRNTEYLEKNLEYWDIHLRSRSFLFRQVRRMVGAMVLVAKGVINLEDLKDVLDKPCNQLPFSSLLGMDECGLFLTDVLYKPEDLQPDASWETAKADPLSLSHNEEESGLAQNSDSCQEASASNLSSLSSVTDEISQRDEGSPSGGQLTGERSNSDFVPDGCDDLTAFSNSTSKR